MLKYGLIGEKLGHSISPHIHTDIFKETSFDGDYKLYEIPREKLPEIKTFMEDNRLVGINVTIPYKQEIIPFLDEISEEAMQIGAVNTVVRKNGRLIGYNTDYYGFGEMLNFHGIAFTNETAVILGNGGAAKAVSAFVSNNGASEVYIVSRKQNEDASVISYDQISDFDNYLLINTTPVGMYPNVEGCPVDISVVEKSSAVVDLIYNPKTTHLIELAEKAGKPCCNGMFMLVAQAVKAQEIWRDVRFSFGLTQKIYEMQNRG